MNTKSYLLHNLNELNSTIGNLEAIVFVQAKMIKNETITDEQFHHRFKIDLNELVSRTTELLIFLSNNTWLPKEINAHLANIRSDCEKIKKVKYKKPLNKKQVNKTKNIVEKIKSDICNIKHILAKM